MSRISKLDISDYNKCNAIWDMKACPYTEKFRKEIELVTELFLCIKKIKSLSPKSPMFLK